jgi:pyruvate dehydrogenase E2 component (dihydrolipoamide acetyltransferase)
MDVLMPQLGETVNEGTVSAWYKKVGDTVEKGDLLLDVETDKAATEIPAAAAGVLSVINVEVGATVDVGTVIAVITVEGEAAVAPVAKEETSGAESAAAAPASGFSKKSAGEKISPAVRRLLKEHNLNIADITGTGRDGRVSRQDVQKHIDGGGSAPAGAPAGVATGKGTRIPFDRIRRVTAEHMVRSKATSPHVLQTMDIDFSAVDKVRLAKRVQWKTDNGYSLSYLPFVAKAICIAIRDFPNVNSSIDGDGLLVHDALHLAVAIDLDFEGLVAPVVKNADSLSVSGLAKQFNVLAGKAKTHKLTADELQGGTYTLSNPGPFGTLFTAAIINQPQVAIMSMDAIKSRPVVIEVDGVESIAIRPVGILAHSFDHRAIDGAYSAAFLNRLKAVIEKGDWGKEFE